jgi:hypothetical protein
MRTHICTYTYIQTPACTLFAPLVRKVYCTRTHTPTYCAYMHALHTHTHTHTNTHTHTHRNKHTVHACMHAYLHTHTPACTLAAPLVRKVRCRPELILVAYDSSTSQGPRIRSIVRAFDRVHVCVYVHVCMCVCVCVCVCVCGYD